MITGENSEIKAYGIRAFDGNNKSVKVLQIHIVRLIKDANNNQEKSRKSNYKETGKRRSHDGLYDRRDLCT